MGLTHCQVECWVQEAVAALVFAGFVVLGYVVIG